jgi:hypothetical protein
MKSKIMLSLMFGMILLASAILASSTVSADYNYTTKWFYNGNPVDNVRVVNYVCTSNACATLGNRIQNTNSGSSNAVSIIYPIPLLNSHGYATYWFAPGFIYEEMGWRPEGSGASSDNFNFEKHSNCHSHINSVSANAAVNEGQAIPITVNIQSAFVELGVLPFAEPNDADLVRDYLSAKTDVTLTIRNASNAVVYTATLEDYVRQDDDLNYQFAWTPDYNGAGSYTITATTNVVDSKCASSSAVSSTPRALTVNDVPIPDTEAPKHSNLQNNPSSATYAPGANYTFSATWTDNTAVDSAWLVFAGNTYAATASGNVYSVTLGDLAAGNYSYQWFANDTAGNENSTSSSIYAVAKATPDLSIDILPGNSVENGTETNATASGSPSVLTYTFYRDGVSITSPDVAVFGVGSYWYTYNTTGNANYTSASVTKKLNVWKQGSDDDSEDDSDNEIIIIDDNEFISGYSFNMDIGDRAKFTFCGAPYYIKLTDIDTDDEKAYFTLTPQTKTFTLEEGEKEELDLNDDGINDVLFKLEKVVSDERVKVYIKRLSNKCEAPKEVKPELEVYGEQTGVLKAESKNSTLTSIAVMLMIGVFLLALAILLYLIGRLNKTKKPQPARTL